jgi:hypothetical protein
MSRIVVVALGALAVSAACFTVRAALPHEDSDLSLPFLGTLNVGSDKPLCHGDRRDSQIVTRDFAWDGGDSVRISIPGTIRYRPGTGERVSMRARAWVLDHVRVENGRIGFDCRNMNNFGAIEVTLPGVPLKRFSLSGAGKMYLEDIRQLGLKIALSGATTIEASGEADSASLSIAGLGHADMSRLIARRLDLKIAGSGDVQVAPQESATISIAGAARVRLVTEPKELSTRIAGAGRILHGAP